MSIFSFFRKRPQLKDEKADEVAIKGSEAVHDSGLTDQESTGFKQSRSIRQSALKGKNKDPNKLHDLD